MSRFLYFAFSLYQVYWFSSENFRGLSIADADVDRVAASKKK